MKEDIIVPLNSNSKEESVIKVIGVGGGGGNAVNHMYNSDLENVDFIVINTDSQDLINSPVDIKIQLGGDEPGGLGAGNIPEKGKEYAEKSIDLISKVLTPSTKMVFITAGMGGGTGTGAAPIVAKAAADKGILTVGVVTIPFVWERKVRRDQAMEGVRELKKYVDTLVIIQNEQIRGTYGNLKISEAFAKADDILLTAVKGISDILTKTGNINITFSHIDTVMRKSGVTLMGTGTAKGENRALDALKEALNSPLLQSSAINGAKDILYVTYTGTKIGEGLTQGESTEIRNYLKKVADKDGKTCNLIPGIYSDETLGEELKITIVATGFKEEAIEEIHYSPKDVEEVKMEEKEIEYEEPTLFSDIPTVEKKEIDKSKTPVTKKPQKKKVEVKKLFD